MTVGRFLVIAGIAALVAGTAWLTLSGAEERTVRQVMEEVQTAALQGLNRKNPNALDGYFASEAEGAVAAGLAQTRQAYQDFVDQLPSTNAVQFHSFDIQALEVHEEARLAKVTYRLHFSVLKNGQPIYSARVTQDLAFRKTPRGWRISGGDAPQLEDVTGTWPPR